MKIYTDEIELAGNILQDICGFFQINDIDTQIAYLDTVEVLNTLIKRIEHLDTVRNRFNINMAEIITIIKDLFVRAEDNRLLDNMQSFKEYFIKINAKNMELLDEFEKRSNTYDELFTDLKQINGLIQNFASLKGRIFKFKISWNI
jgi:Bardet-Biedl syndrome 2 protein